MMKVNVYDRNGNVLMVLTLSAVVASDMNLTLTPDTNGWAMTFADFATELKMFYDNEF